MRRLRRLLCVGSIGWARVRYTYTSPHQPLDYLLHESFPFPNIFCNFLVLFLYSWKTLRKLQACSKIYVISTRVPIARVDYLAFLIWVFTFCREIPPSYFYLFSFTFICNLESWVYLSGFLSRNRRSWRIRLLSSTIQRSRYDSLMLSWSLDVHNDFLSGIVKIGSNCVSLLNTLFWSSESIIEETKHVEEVLWSFYISWLLTFNLKFQDLKRD